jgi:hypothetical protein
MGPATLLVWYGAMARARLLHSPFLWFFVAIAIAETLFHALLPYTELAATAAGRRNPLPLRGWPEYVAASAAPAGSPSTRVVVIGNSQGVAPELPRGERLFPALIEETLNGAGRNVAVINWSVVGLATDHLEVLSIEAARRGIDLVVIAASLKSLDIAGTTRLGASADDVDLLAGNPAAWPWYRDSLLAATTRADDLLLRAIYLGSALGRSRQYGRDLLAATISTRHHRFAFGATRSRRAQQTLAERRAAIPNAATPHGGLRPDPVPAETWSRQFRHSRLPTFHALIPRLGARLKASGTRLLWVWMPIAPSLSNANLRRAAAPIYTETCAELAAAGIPCLDLMDSIPLEHFVSRGVSSHLDEDGHARVAALIAPAVNDALH